MLSFVKQKADMQFHGVSQDEDLQCAHFSNGNWNVVISKLKNKVLASLFSIDDIMESEREKAYHDLPSFKRDYSDFILKMKADLEPSPDLQKPFQDIVSYLDTQKAVAFTKVFKLDDFATFATEKECVSISMYSRSVYCDMRKKELKAAPYDNVDAFKRDFEAFFG